ncbi:MAG: hypothetical protein WCJ64_23965, partial [Rhodospirillaceae bacterium]
SLVQVDALHRIHAQAPTPTASGSACRATGLPDKPVAGLFQSRNGIFPYDPNDEKRIKMRSCLLEQVNRAGETAGHIR